MRIAVLSVVLLAFTVFSTWVAATHGPLGFLTLAAREPWGLQLLLDLVIALSLFASWMRGDSRARGLPYWPYLVAIVLLGSIGALPYLLHRELRARRTGAAS